MSAPHHYAASGPCRVREELEVWHDERRQRPIPCRHYLPQGVARTPLILFSHGLGGDRDNGERWLCHWASHGYRGLALQHAGSDAAVMAGSPMALRRALTAATTPEQSLARLADLGFVLDEVWRRQAADPAWAGVDLERVGLAGHSYGAVTTQAMAGERRAYGPPVAEPRLRAFLGLSPSARGEEAPLNARFSGIRCPFFCITGTRDDGIGLHDISAADRTVPFRHMPGGDKFLLVLDGAAHMPLAGNPGSRHVLPPRAVTAIQGASLAFWEATLGGRQAARTWLCQDFPSTLVPGDTWECK
jgi:pimeloyl-ACP methyl ester carboxylesterase